MFAYAGSASFPTYQADMRNKSDFPKSVLMAMISKKSYFQRFLIETRVRLDYVTIQNAFLKLNFKFLILFKVSDFNLNQFVLVMKDFGI